MRSNKIVNYCIFFCFCLLGCEKKTSLYENKSIVSLTSNIAVIQAYTIPLGVFRGAIQPTSGKPYFTIWNIEEGREFWYHVKTPENFYDSTAKITTEDWEFIMEETNGVFIYYAKMKNKNVHVKFQLPLKKRPYIFYVLQNQAGKDLIVFGDLSEEIIDEGLFGYILLYEQQHTL